MNRIKKSLIGIVSALTITGTSCSSENGEFLEKKLERSNSLGEVVIGERKILIKNQNGNILPRINVHYLSDGLNEMILAVDPNEEYYPKKKEFNKFKPGRSALLAETVLIMNFIAGFKTLQEDLANGPGKLFSQEKNVNKYCATLEQISHSVIDVPAGIISIGYHELKIASNTTLKPIFETYVKKYFGEYDNYEVWIPKETASLCGSNYDQKVCMINNEILSRQLWQHDGVPYWEIKGSCNESKTNENSNKSYDNINNHNDSEGSEGSEGSDMITCEGSQIYRDNKCIQKICNSDYDCNSDENCIDACITDTRELVTKESWICTEERECLYRRNVYRCMDVCVKLF